MKRTTTLTLFVFSATLLLAISQASAQMVNIAISQDTSLYSHNAAEILDMNMGAYTSNANGVTHPVLGFDRRDASTRDHVNAILEASSIVSDLANAGVSSGSQIASADLHLFRVQDESFDRTGRAFRVTTGGWVEGTPRLARPLLTVSATAIWLGTPPAVTTTQRSWVVGPRRRVMLTVRSIRYRSRGRSGTGSITPQRTMGSS